MKRSLILHPFLFAIYGILAPVATSITDVGLGAVKLLVIDLVAVAVLLNIVNLAVKQREKTALLVTGVVLGFFSYGHVNGLLTKRVGASLFLDIVLLLIFVGVLVLWVYFVLYRLNNTRGLSNYLNIVGLVAVTFPLYSIVTFTRQTTNLQEIATQYQQQTLQESGVSLIDVSQVNGQTRPDIYYIILDSYTRDDVLKELYGYDNSAFLSELEKRGFYVVRSSRSNYSDTAYSIAATLNMMHVNTLPDFARQKVNITDENVLRDIFGIMVQHNRVVSFLKEQGYSIVGFDSSYDRINLTSADYYEHSPKVGRINPQAAFDVMLMDTTLGKLYLKLRGKDYKPLQTLFADHRERVRYTLANLPKFADSEGEYFVYAHVISPHYPYLFGPNGEDRIEINPYTLLDQTSSEGWDPTLYTDQITYINKLVLAAIDEILLKSDSEPIIILQADHSSRAHGEKDMSDQDRMKLLLPILNAYYLPDGAASQILFPEITPINQFRLIFNNYFGTNLEMLPEDSYVLESHGGKLDFINACKVYGVCSGE